MRIIIFLMVLRLGSIYSQNAALTAGSESLTNQYSEHQSITSGETVITQSGNFTKSVDAEETKLSAGKEKVSPPVSSKPNAIIYLVVFILIGIAFYFINLKIRNSYTDNIVRLESEENDKLKKEIWQKLSSDNPASDSPSNES